MYPGSHVNRFERNNILEERYLFARTPVEKISMLHRKLKHILYINHVCSNYMILYLCTNTSNKHNVWCLSVSVKYLTLALRKYTLKPYEYAYHIRYRFHYSSVFTEEFRHCQGDSVLANFLGLRMPMEIQRLTHQAAKGR